MSYEECFMCGKTNRNILEDIDFVDLTTIMPASQKRVQSVLDHLAGCIRTKLIFSEDTTICSNCYEELTAYDQLMVQLLASQKNLTNRLQKVLSMKTDADEIESIFEPINDSQLADALNPDLDTKEELVEGDEIAMIEYTMDAMDTDENDEVRTDERTESEDDANASDQRRVIKDCTICGESFKTKMLLKKHIKKAHKGKSFECEVCGVKRKDEEYLELHMNIHEGKTELECRYCERRFSRPVNTLRHMRKHWDKKGYQCEKCGERFSLDNMLYNHRLRHEAEENPLICSICNQTFKSIKTYNHHQLIHQENRPRHQCPICPKSFTERYTLKMHMGTHGSLKELECTAVSIEEVETEEDNPCVICDTKFTSRESLNLHLKDNHDVILK